MKDQPNLTIVRNDLWGGRCFACLYKVLQPLFVNTPRVDVLKIQGREGVEEDLEGVQYTMLADIFLHLREELTQKVQQIVFHAAINARTLVDSVGRESEHAWNMFATQQLLSGYECVYLMPGQGPYKQLPTQFEHLLKQAELDPIFGIYTTSYRRIADPAQRAAHQQLLQAYKPQKAEKLIAKPPAYCEVRLPVHLVLFSPAPDITVHFLHLARSLTTYAITYVPLRTIACLTQFSSLGPQ